MAGFTTPWGGLMSQDQLLNSLNTPYNRVSGGFDQAQQAAMAAAQQRLGAQFAPQFRTAQQRLGGSPLLADSGYANRLNRQLQQGAYGELSNQYGQIAANTAQQKNNAYLALLQQRMQNQDQLQQMKYQHDLSQPTFGQIAGGIIGAGVGAFAGPYLGGLGAKMSGYKGTF